MANQSKDDDDNDEYPIGDREILALLEESRLALEKGDKSALMRCVFRCARFQAVIPEWAVDALLEIQEKMESGHFVDFNDAFGKPSEKVNTRAAKKRIKTFRQEVLIVLTRLRTLGLSLNIVTMCDEAYEILQSHSMPVTLRDIKAIYASHGAFIKDIPRKRGPLQGRYAVGNIVLKYGRRKGRNTLKD